MNLQLQVQLTADDYLEAQKMHVRGIVFTIGWLLIPVAFLVLLVTLGITDYRVWLGLTVASVIWFFVFRARFGRAVAKKLRKMFDAQKDLQRVYSLHLTDENIKMSSPERGEWIVLWTDFIMWRGNDKVVLGYVGDAIFRIFPRRWFASDADYASFQELLAKSIGPMGKARKAST